MSKKTIYICDICGEEFADKISLRSTVIPAMRDDGYGNESVRPHEVDMCDSCRDQLEQLIIRYFAEIHVDAYGARTQNVIRKDSTTAELKAMEAHWEDRLRTKQLHWNAALDAVDERHAKEIEELNTEHEAELHELACDVEELEGELERLRDVRDQLFETNFKLTALLRAHGIEVEE